MYKYVWTFSRNTLSVISDWYIRKTINTTMIYKLYNKLILLEQEDLRGSGSFVANIQAQF